MSRIGVPAAFIRRVPMNERPWRVARRMHHDELMSQGTTRDHTTIPVAFSNANGSFRLSDQPSASRRARAHSMDS